MINEGCGWVIESLCIEYMNISIFSPLSRSTYIELPRRLGKPMKVLINIKNNDNKCFRWCHIRHLNPLNINPERIAKENKIIVNNLDYENIEFPVSKKHFTRLKRKVIVALMRFVMKIIWFILLYWCIR